MNSKHEQLNRGNFRNISEDILDLSRFTPRVICQHCHGGASNNFFTLPNLRVKAMDATKTIQPPFCNILSVSHQHQLARFFFLSRPSIFYDLVNLPSNLLSKLTKPGEQEWNYTCNLGENPLFHERFPPEYLEQVSAQENMMELSLKDHLVGR